MYAYQIIPPSAALRRYVRYYWSLQSGAGGIVTERTIPAGCIQLVFHKGERLFSQTRHRMQPRHFVCGQERGYADICGTGRIEMLAVVFQPYAAKLFFRQPLVLFQDEHVAVEDMEDEGLAELARKVADTESHALCIEQIERFLLRRLASRADYNVERLSAVTQRIRLAPALRVRDLADTACLGTKQFTRIFAEYVGTSPKEFLRIVRVQRALFLLQQHPQRDWAQMAYSCGFADQSHMIREFRLFVGYTPVEYLSAHVPVSDYFSTP